MSRTLKPLQKGKSCFGHVLTGMPLIRHGDLSGQHAGLDIMRALKTGMRGWIWHEALHLVRQIQHVAPDLACHIKPVRGVRP